MRGQVGAAERALFFRCLGLMFDSGVPLGRAFEVLSRQSHQPALSQSCRQVSQLLLQGQPLSQALRRAGTPLSPLSFHLVELGERSGTLGRVLRGISDYEERVFVLQQKLQAQLTYPMLVLLVCGIAFLTLPPWLFDSLRPALGSTPLPWFSRLVLWLSGLAGSPWLWLSGVAFLGLSRRYWLARLPRLPLLADVLQQLAQARFLRALALSLRAGVPLQHSLKLAGASSGSEAISQACGRVVESVYAGSSLAAGLAEQAEFSGLVVQFARAGEESGRLADLLQRLAELYDVELEAAVQRFIALLEPALMLLMGLATGAFILATGLPLLRLVQSL